MGMPAKRATEPVRTSTRRQPADVLRLALGLVILGWATIAAGSREPGVVELNLFRLVNQLPGPFGPPLIGVMQLGALAAVPVFAVVCVLSGRRRLARLLAFGGVAAWLVAKGLGATVAKRPPDERISGVVLHGAITPGLSFPATHVAVAAAIATVASPYLSRSARRTVWILVALVAVARVYVGAHFPVDVAGGFAVGWVVGSVVHLLFGAPRGFPDPKLLALRLGQHGLDRFGSRPATASRSMSGWWTAIAAKPTGSTARGVSSRSGTRATNAIAWEPTTRWNTRLSHTCSRRAAALRPRR
jgi:membrane-associated phospholipid phosphatase